MQYRNLGRSGLKVSRVALGSWLTHGMSVDEGAAFDSFQLAFEHGINFFDTANVYNRGEAEKVLGSWLQGTPREHVVLASKVFFPMSDHWMDQGLSQRHIVNACAASLERLQVDYLDLYYCHRFDPDTPLEETCFAMHQLIENGWVLHWGVSEWTSVQLLRALHICDRHGWRRPICNQPLYHMLNRRLEVDVMQTCEEEGLGLVTFSPLAQGILTGKYRRGQIPGNARAANETAKRFFPFELLTEATDRKLEGLERIAQSLKMTLAQLAIAWCLRLKPVTTVILGASNHQQLEETLKASTVILTREVQEQVEEVLGNRPTDQYSGAPVGYTHGL